MRPKQGDPAPPGLEGVDWRFVNMLVTADGLSGDGLSPDRPHGLDEIEVAIDGTLDRLWADHRPALLAESRRRGVPPGTSWGEVFLDRPWRAIGPSGVRGDGD
jgi:hypothetical protein